MTEERLTSALALASALLIAASLFAGPIALSLGAVIAALDGQGDETARLIVTEVRLPRALMAWLVGAALGMTGAALQGLLRNPLADAGVLGLSGFAALGAVIAFAFGLAAIWAPAVPIMAIGFALAAALFVTVLARRAKSAATLALIGIGLSSLAGGLIALALNLAPNPAALSDLVNWTLGSVEGRSFADIAGAAPFIALGAVCLLLAGRGLQALTLGEESAAALGAHLGRTRALVVFGAAAAAGAATAFVGVIGFVGVAAPHLVRRACGYDPARILVPSALTGSVLLLLADFAVRLLPTDAELKLGVAAALVGGPLFALIAARLARRGGI